MTQTRSEDPKPQSRPVLSAFISTFATQPIRVMLSRSQEDFWPWHTLFKGWFAIGNGLPINLFRGTTSTALSAYAKKYTGEFVEGSSPVVKMSAMLCASSVVDMAVAYGCETWFIRRSNLPKNNILHGIKRSPFNFSVALPPLYLIRAVGFGAIVFYSNDLPPVQQNSLLIGGTVFTATAQKFISAVATGDLMAHEGTVPDFKGGVTKTLRNVANGVYTHPSYRAYFPTPETFAKQFANFMYIGCNPSIFAWRLAYLYSVKYAYKKAEENSDLVVSKLSMFAATLVNNKKSYLLTDSERDIMEELDNHNPFYKHL